MSKEWGAETPNISKFVKAVPASAAELLSKLQNMAENWKYVDKCGVIKSYKAIMVDLGWMANTAGKTPDFYIPIKALEVDKADALVKALNAKADSATPIVEQDAIALFATVETAA